MGGRREASKFTNAEKNLATPKLLRRRPSKPSGPLSGDDDATEEGREKQGVGNGGERVTKGVLFTMHTTITEDPERGLHAETEIHFKVPYIVQEGDEEEIVEKFRKALRDRLRFSRAGGRGEEPGEE